MNLVTLHKSLEKTNRGSEVCTTVRDQQVWVVGCTPGAKSAIYSCLRFVVFVRHNRRQSSFINTVIWLEFSYAV